MSNQIETISDAAKRFAIDVIDKANQDSLSELFASRPPHALYYRSNRNGVSAVAIPTTGLTTEQLIKLQRYRLAQYISIGFVDAQAVYERKWEYEPLSLIGTDDIHLIAASADTGKILCYASLYTLPDAPADATLRERERPLYPVEENFGWGIYNKLQILPYLPTSRILELKRFVKNQSLHTLDEAGIRAPVELGIMLVEITAGASRLQADALVGSLEESVGKRNLDFFHIPLVVLHGAMPVADENDYLLPHYRDTESYPFAILLADVPGPAVARAQQVEQALEQPGRRGILALMQLRSEVSTRKSSLVPPRGLDPLADAPLPQKDIPMHVRRQMFSLGNQLRHFDLFQGLSVAETTMLRTFMESVTAEPGDVVVLQGEAGDAIFLIEEGNADVMVHRAGGGVVTVGQLGPGQYFGEIGLLSGGLRTADVVATVPMKLLKLTREIYMRYLTERSEVEQQMAATAARRIVDTGRKVAQPGKE